MKLVTASTIYNTDTSHLLKSSVRVEDLGNGYVRYSTYRIYSRPRAKDYFMYVNKVATDGRCRVIDVQDYISPCTLDFIKRFSRDYDDVLDVS